jgi:hypothetical protein
MSPIYIAEATDTSHLQRYVAYNMLRCCASLNTFIALVFEYLSVRVAYDLSPQYERRLGEATMGSNKPKTDRMSIEKMNK